MMEGRREISRGDAVVARIFVEGELVLESPLCIGTGEHDARVDATVLKGADGNPYVPGTSMAGALRAAITDSCSSVTGADLGLFWGSGGEEGLQSAFIVGDATVAGNHLALPVEERDGVSIDPGTGTAVKGRKYNFDIVPAGNRFSWRGETVVRACDDPVLMERFTQTVCSMLVEGYVRLGAHTANGFGHVKLVGARTCKFDLTNADGIRSYLQFCATNQMDSAHPLACEPFQHSSTEFSIEADFSLASALIVRSYSTDPAAPDESSVQSGGRHVVPGPSLKGALRHRAMMIISSLGVVDAEHSDDIRGLFGYASTERPEDGEPEASIKSRFFVDESIVTDARPEVQTRIQVDRFTGGVRQGAFLESEPLWSNRGQERVHVRIAVRNCTGWEAGLLLLLLKDLWTGDLQLGGERSVGRGGLRGVKAVIGLGSHRCEIVTEGQALCVTPEAESQWLESCVSDLVAWADTHKGGKV